jgi:hypothetical protein
MKATLFLMALEFYEALIRKFFEILVICILIFLELHMWEMRMNIFD